MIARILKIYGLFLAQNIKKEMMYRTSFFILIVIDFVAISVPVIFFHVLFSDVDTIGGWSFPAILILVGSVSLLRELAYLTFRDGLGALGEQIRTGRFDVLLTKPFPTQLLVAFREISLVESLGEGAVGFLLIVYGFTHLAINATFFHVVLYIFLLLVSFILYYSIVLLINSIAFWIVRAESLGALMWTFMEMARYPREILRGIGKIFFTFVIPISLVATVPSSALAGNIKLDQIALLMFLTVAFFALATFVWKRGIQHYNSASS